MLAQMLLVAGILGAAPDAVLLNFTQENCPPCRAMEPVLAELEASGLSVQTIQVEQHPEFVQRFKVEGTPTYVMLVDNREAGRVIGVTNADKLRALFPNAGPAVRGQSPESPSYLSERLGGMFGKGGNAARSSAPPQNGASSTDPFTKRQFDQPEVRNAGGEAARPELRTLEHTTRAEPNINPQERAMKATVRLKVEEPQGQAIGTGTIVDTHGDDAVLITCAHVFRASQGKGRIQVEVFHPQPQTLEGKLLDYDLERDIAVVEIKPGAGAVSAPVAPTGLTVNKQDPAFSVGCDKGADPTVRETKITNLNRYVGPPNIEAHGEPTIGRSGGGLFDREGYLIGVCNCADAQDNEGIYAAIASIHWQLDKIGMAELFQQPQKTAEMHADLATADFREEDPREVSPRRADPAGSSDQNELEVIAIVRSRNNPSGKGNVIVIPKASKQLLQQIAADSGDSTTAADLSLSADRRSAAAPLGNAGPVVRGQSQR